MRSLALRALWLDGDAYRKMSERSRPVADGFRSLLVLGMALGLAAVVRAAVNWAISPDLDAVQRLLRRELLTLPLLWRLYPPIQRLLLQVSQHPWLWWMARWQWPTPLLALLYLLTVPLELLLDWLGYSLVAHAAASLLGGRGSLGQTLGCTALATVPRALLLLPLLPPLGLEALGVWAWVLAGRFLALRAAHGLEGWRAFWAALAPVALLAAVAGALLAVGLPLAWIAGGMGR